MSIAPPQTSDVNPTTPNPALTDSVLIDLRTVAPSDASSDGPVAIDGNHSADSVSRQLEWIGLRVRWIGLLVGYGLVNLFPDEAAQADRGTLNMLLAAGTVFTAVGTAATVYGRPLFRNLPLLAAAMEAVFITLLCHYDRGLTSPFRFYYIVALVITGLRYRPLVSWSCYAIHSGAYVSLAAIGRYVANLRDAGDLPTGAEIEAKVGTVFLMLWVTYASNAIGTLLQTARRRVGEANERLQALNDTLEGRIARRTNQLKESQALLVQRERQAAFGLLAAGIAHEVGNPLAGISSVTQMLGRHLTKAGHMDDYTLGKLSTVDEQLRRIQRTLRELTDFSRPSDPVRRKTDCVAACRSALEIAKYYARRKGKTIVEDYADDVPVVLTIKDELVQVVLNLVLNAMDATDDNAGVDGRIEVRVAPSADGRSVQVAIADNGCGIPEESQRQVFEPYYTTKDHGTGLGLFVCRRIVEQSLFGSLRLTSSRPGETVFQIELPIESDTAPSDSSLNISLMPASSKESPASPTPTN